MLKVFSGIKALYAKWKIIAEKIGNFQFSVIFSVFYFLFVAPLGLVSSFFTDFLMIKARPRWIQKKPDSDNLKQLMKQS